MNGDDGYSGYGDHGSSNADDRTFPPMFWHALVVALLIAVITAGCSSGNSSPAPAKPAGPMGPVAPAPVAPDTSPLSPLARAPKAVQDAFAKDYPDGATVAKVRHRLMPDGFVHYTINSTDLRYGKAHEDEYRADGVKVPATKE
jgi:hypothetical protein